MRIEFQVILVLCAMVIKAPGKIQTAAGGCNFIISLAYFSLVVFHIFYPD